METKYGTIVTMKKEKGYGFIKPDDGKYSKDNLFFHARDVLSPEYQGLNLGDRVEYIEKETNKGKIAYGVVAV